MAMPPPPKCVRPTRPWQRQREFCAIQCPEIRGLYSGAQRWRRRYRRLLEKADIECPPPDESRRKGKRGRLKRSKARNLLERLRDSETDVLRFMTVENVPFTNNQGENDLRMTKVQQKISGCFRSMEGARLFCRVRSYLSTCRKHGLSTSQALTLLFQGKNPDFMQADVA